jgi:hypothetical protein
VSVDLSFGRYDGPGTTHVILFCLFDSVLTDVTKGIQEEDLVQVTLECPDLDFPIRLPFIQMVILSSVQQSAFDIWKEAVVVMFSLVSIEIFLSSKTLLAYSTGKGIMVFI